MNHYELIHWSVFTAPVDNPDVLNFAKAGRTIPLKWRITDANSNPVTNLTGVSVTAVSVSCPSAPTAGAIEEYVASSSGLQNLGGWRSVDLFLGLWG